MKQCRECRTLSPDDTVFCYICGTRFPENNSEGTYENTDADNVLSENKSLVVDSVSHYEAGMFALKTSGVYYFVEGGFRYLLRFYPDGIVQGASDTNTTIPSATEIRGISYRDRGRYSIVDQQLDFNLRNQQGQVDYWGQILRGTLILNLHSHINGHHASNRVYQFVEM